MKFFGRQEEIQTLRRQLELCEKRHCARMVVVTGRRRIGKTTLILKALQGRDCPFVYCFVPRVTSERELAVQIISMLSEQLEIRFPPTLTRLSETINYVLELSKKQPLVLVIDECQDIDSFAPAFWSELQKVWDLGKNDAKLLLVMSGSLQSSLERIFGDKSEPLYGRCDVLMTLPAFSCETLQEIFTFEGAGARPADFLTLYALTGGVARYVEYFVDNEAMTREAMLRQIFSNDGSWFRSEGNLMLANEFRLSSPIYLEILQKIAAGSTKRSEIQDNISQDVSAYIKRLEELFGIVSRVSPLLRENNVRQMRYRIADPYFRFWLQFISPVQMQALAEAGMWTRMIQLVEKALPTFLGRSLEQWFVRQTLETGQWDLVGGWWDRKGQNEIDLVAINQETRKILIGEVKTNPKKFQEEMLCQKAQVFLNELKLQNYEVELRGLSVEDMLNEKMLEYIDDQELIRLVQERKDEPLVDVDLDRF